MSASFSIVLRIATLAAFASLAPVAVSATPQSCTEKFVKSSGGAGVLESSAKSRARSAWMRKVRASKKLGKDYSAWLKAQDQTYACKKVGKRHVCEASARPCKV